MSLKKVPFGNLEAFNVVVEVSTGSQKKYAYDHDMEVIKLTRVLYDEAKFPFNYGYVAETLAFDGGNLDAFILSTHPIGRGTVATCRAVGIIKVMDRGKQDDKIIAIPINETRLKEIQDIKNIPEKYILAFKDFFGQLAEQWHNEIKILSFEDKESAKKELLKLQNFD